jgi:hypothetical protein
MRPSTSWVVLTGIPNRIFSEIIRQHWLPLSETGFGDLLAQGKSPKVSILEAKLSHHRQDSKNFPENILLSEL